MVMVVTEVINVPELTVARDAPPAAIAVFDGSRVMELADGGDRGDAGDRGDRGHGGDGCAGADVGTDAPPTAVAVVCVGGGSRLAEVTDGADSRS